MILRYYSAHCCENPKYLRAEIVKRLDRESFIHLPLSLAPLVDVYFVHLSTELRLSTLLTLGFGGLVTVVARSILGCF